MRCNGHSVNNTQQIIAAIVESDTTIKSGDRLSVVGRSGGANVQSKSISHRVTTSEHANETAESTTPSANVCWINRCGLAPSAELMASSDSRRLARINNKCAAPPHASNMTRSEAANDAFNIRSER